MKYRYPKISNCLIYKKIDMDTVEIENFLTEEVYIADIEEARYMKNLDGKTHPYDIKTALTWNEIDELIEELGESELLKETNRIGDLNSAVQTIWEPEWTPFLKLFAFFFNHLLMLLWLPALIIGILVFKNNFLSVDYEMMWLGNILGIVIGIILHEFGHAFAAVSYGARVFEMGLLRMYYIIPGAYVMMDDRTIKSRLKKVQIDAAGVEVNLLLAGIFLILGAVFGNLGGMFLSAGLQNIFIAILNLTLIKGFDGMAIVSELLGIEDIFETATDVITDRTTRKRLRKNGLAGNAIIVTCCLIFVFQIALPLLLALNVLEVVLCFI